MDLTIDNELVTVLTEFLREGGDFAKSQAPELCNELLMRGLMQNWFLVIISGLIFVIPFIFHFLTRKHWDRYIEVIGPLTFILSLAQVGSFLLLCLGSCELLTIYFTPRAYLLDCLKGFIN